MCSRNCSACDVLRRKTFHQWWNCFFYKCWVVALLYERPYSSSYFLGWVHQLVCCDISHLILDVSKQRVIIWMTCPSYSLLPISGTCLWMWCNLNWHSYPLPPAWKLECSFSIPSPVFTTWISMFWVVVFMPLIWAFNLSTAATDFSIHSLSSFSCEVNWFFVLPAHFCWWDGIVTHWNSTIRVDLVESEVSLNWFVLFSMRQDKRTRCVV